MIPQSGSSVFESCKRLGKTWATILLIILILVLPSVGTAQSPSQLPPPVLKALKKHRLSPDGLSLFVQDTAAKQPLLAFNADTPRHPASAIKVLTTFAGLEILGPAFEWKTEAYWHGNMQDDTLHGDLYLKGYGDPFLTAEMFWKLLSALRDRGLRHISGELVIDSSYFAPAQQNNGAFDGQPYEPYNALPNAFLLNFQAIEFLLRPDSSGRSVHILTNPRPANLTVTNQLQLSKGRCNSQNIGMSVAGIATAPTVTFKGRYPAKCGESTQYHVVMPADAMAVGTFATLWQQLGGSFSGRWHSGPVPAKLKPRYSQSSRPLAELIRGMNKFSNNVMTRQLFLTLGADRFGAPATLEKSRRAVNQWLQKRGLNFPELIIDNGAGLSRQTRISARSMGRVLLTAFHSPFGAELQASLPLAGIDGTVRRRFRKQPQAGQMRLKTGTLNSVRALAGYAKSRSGRTYVLAVLHNQRGVDQGIGTQVQDALLRWLYER